MTLIQLPTLILILILLCASFFHPTFMMPLFPFPPSLLTQWLNCALYNLPSLLTKLSTSLTSESLPYKYLPSLRLSSLLKTLPQTVGGQSPLAPQLLVHSINPTSRKAPPPFRLIWSGDRRFYPSSSWTSCLLDISPYLFGSLEAFPSHPLPSSCEILMSMWTTNSILRFHSSWTLLSQVTFTSLHHPYQTALWSFTDINRRLWSSAFSSVPYVTSCHCNWKYHHPHGQLIQKPRLSSPRTLLL